MNIKTGLFVLAIAALGTEARAQLISFEFLGVPPSSIESVTCGHREVVAGKDAPYMVVGPFLGGECRSGDTLNFEVEVAVYADAVKQQAVRSVRVPVRCSLRRYPGEVRIDDDPPAGTMLTPGEAPVAPSAYDCAAQASVPGIPAPNAFTRNFDMTAVRSNQLPRGGGRIFAGFGSDVNLENVASFATYMPGAEYAIDRYWVWEICRYTMTGSKTCTLVDITDQSPFGSSMPYCGLKPPAANDKGYCYQTKVERLATEGEKRQHIYGVLWATCRGEPDDFTNWCHVVHADRFIVKAQSSISPYLQPPYGAGSTWGYAVVRGDRIYPMSSDAVSPVSRRILDGGTEVEDIAKPGLPAINTYE